MFRCLIRNCLLLFAVLPAVAGANAKPGWQQWQQIAQCRTINCQVFDDSLLWIGTDECGLARFSPLSGQMRFITNQNSDLPSNSVNCLAFDRERVMWIGTDEGLARFDGQAWRIFRADNAPFPTNSVSAVACDDSGNVWAGFTRGGVLVYSSSGWTNLLEKQPGYPLTLAGNTVYAIVPVNAQAAWISWNPFYKDYYGLAFLEESGWHAYGYTGLRWIAAGKDGAIWFCAYEWTGTRYRYGLARLRYPDSLTTYLTPESFFPSNTYAYLTAVAIDDTGRKWAGAGNRVLRLSDTVWTQLPLIEDTASVKGTVSAIAFDKTGRAWAGFNRADADPLVACLSGDTWSSCPVHGSSIPFNFVRFICPTPDGGAWVGSENSIARLRSGQWELFPSVDSVYSSIYYNSSICPDGHDGLWIAKPVGFIHGDGRYWKVFPMPASFAPITVYADTQGLIWAGMPYSSPRGYSLVAFDTLMNIIEEKDSLPSNVIGMTQTTDGSLWAAIYDAGFLRRAPDGSWTRITSANSNLCSDTVTGILAGPDGMLWAGTENRGLACFANGQWTAYDTLNSDIPGQSIRPLCIDTFGNLWLVANSLVKFDGMQWTVYTTINSGLPSNTVYAAAPGDSGRIWVGTDKGLARFNADYEDAIYQGPRPHAKACSDGNQIRFQIRNGIVTLHASLPYIVSVLIFDSAGRKVHATGEASTANGKSAISLPRLPPGFYFARISMQPAEGLPNVIQKHFLVLGY